ncbi:hypothetical protein [Mariniflexile sp. HMF6888]|uniref:hypothetical protein n=1 Tax=Mariniflexile sp. HMF6888 TaxID=3373086 RepID=UPI003789D9B5
MLIEHQHPILELISILFFLWKIDEILLFERKKNFNFINDSLKEYSVSFSNNAILLTESNGVDYGILIEFTDEYVDSFKTITPSNITTLSERIYKKNSDNNIISYIGSSTKSIYSKYVKGNIKPIFLSEYYEDYFLVFGLKNTWSAVKHFIKKNGFDPTDELRSDIEKNWGFELKREVRFPLLLKIGIIKI